MSRLSPRGITVRTTMAKWTMLAVFVAVTAAVAAGSILPRNKPIWNNEDRIISGEEAEPKQFPHQVALFNEQGAFCGGSIISDRWVLTAAHCAVRSKRFTLYVGAHNIMKPSEVGRRAHVATKAIVHEHYNSTTLQHDVAVIQTLSSINFSVWVSPVVLPGAKHADELFVNRLATVSGWGLVKGEGGSISPVLRFVSVTVISNEECNSHYDSEPILETTLCAQGMRSKSTCNGDSGGPLITQIDGQNIQIGVVSFVSNSGCEAGLPHGYSRLTKYIPWVQNATGIVIS